MLVRVVEHSTPDFDERALVGLQVGDELLRLTKVVVRNQIAIVVQAFDGSGQFGVDKCHNAAIRLRVRLRARDDYFLAVLQTNEMSMVAFHEHILRERVHAQTQQSLVHEYRVYFKIIFKASSLVNAKNNIQL